MEESFRKWLEALSHHYPSGVIDLLKSPKQRRTPKQKKKKELKSVAQSQEFSLNTLTFRSHRLTDVPLEVVDEVEWEKSISSSSPISVLLLTLLLTILRIIWLLVSIPSMYSPLHLSFAELVFYLGWHRHSSHFLEVCRPRSRGV